MFNKIIALSLFVSISFAGNLWQTGWTMGTSTYSLTNKNNVQLLFECGDLGANIYLTNSNGKEVKLGQMVSALINGVNYETITEVNDETIPEGQVVWNNFINKISEAKKISILTNKGSFNFEPNNSNSIIDIKESCTIASDSKNSYEQEKDYDVETSTPLQINITKEPNNITYIPIPILHLVGLRTKPFKINQIIVNKGNCRVTSYGISKLKNKLAYGQEVTIPLVANSMCQRILEIEIKTNVGDYNFNNN